MKRQTLVLSLAATSCGIALSMPAAAHDEPVIGVVGGAGAGALIAGAPGAVVGAVIGGIAGATVAHDSDHGRRAHRHPHRHRVAAAPQYCEPGPAYYRPAAQRVTYVRAVDARPRLKKAC